MSLTDEETDREIHQIDINQEIIIPKIKPTSLFSDANVDDENHVDSQEQQRQNKLKRQRTSVNQNRRDYDTLLMETSLMIIDPSSMSPPPPPPFSPPPLTPDSPHPAHLNPNVVTANVPATLALSLPLNANNSSNNNNSNNHSHARAEPSTSHSGHSHKHHKHHHKHSHQLKDGAKQPPTESELVLSPAKLQ